MTNRLSQNFAFFLQKDRPVKRAFFRGVVFRSRPVKAFLATGKCTFGAPKQ